MVVSNTLSHAVAGCVVVTRMPLLARKGKEASRMLLRAAWGTGENELCALDKEKSVAAPSELIFL